MSTIMSNILMAVIAVAVPAVSAAVISAVNSFTTKQKQETENALTQSILTEISEAVATAVNATSQTYVDSLKDANAFDKDAQQTALRMALSTCLTSLSKSAKEYITNSYGDISDYLVNKIEATIFTSKSVNS